MEVDVAIVGAGPAGSTLATLLAQRGASVALIDRDRFPRDKLCGEFLSYDALPVLERMGLVPRLKELGAETIRRCRVSSLEFDLPAPSLGISRLRFDGMLFEAAVNAGAVAMEGWAADLGSDHSLVLKRGDETQRVSARVIVGAWGRWGRIDRALDRKFVRDRGRRFFGFKRHYRGGAEPGTIELRSFPGGYLGVSRVEGGVTNICGLVHHSRISGLKGGWEAFTRELSLDGLFDHEPVDEGFLSSEPVIFRAKSPVERGILMIGDAAGLIDPLTGSGMAIAIQSALIAAPAILSNSPETYRREFHEFFASRLRWSRRIAFLLSRPALLRASLVPAHPKAGRFLAERTRADPRLLDRAMRAWFG